MGACSAWMAAHHRDFEAVLSGTGIDAIALDLPGFGGAAAPDQAWGTGDYAEAVAAVLEEMAPQVVVLGHSFGGCVAVRLAASHPDQVGGLVLSGAPLHRPAGGASKPRLRFRAARRLAARGIVSQQRMEALRQRYGSDDYRAASGVMREVLVRTLAEDYAAAIAAVQCPVELVWGDDDTAAPLATAERLQRELRDARLVVCPGEGHLTLLQLQVSCVPRLDG